MSEEATAIAVLQTNYLNLAEKIDNLERKEDAYHEKMEKKLDEISTEFQKFGGLYSQQVSINERVNKIENRLDNVEEVFLECKKCQAIKSDTGSRAKDTLWELVKMALVAGTVLAGSAIWTQYFVK